MTCTHHWMLQSARPQSAAICKYCGASREFAGGIPEQGQSWRRWAYISEDHEPERVPS